jgi:hypothetical protein
MPKPPLTHPLAPLSEPLKRSESWWITAPIVGFTQRAERERERMNLDVISRKVPDQIMGRYTGLNRPVE